MQKKINILFISLLFITNAFAQLNFVKKDINEKGTVTIARLNTDSLPQPLQKSVQVLEQLNPAIKGTEWKNRRQIKDELGFPHEYYEQYYKGVRIEDGNYSIHGTKEGDIELIIGNFQPINEVSTNPTLSETQALNKALQFVNADIYKWEIPEEEAFMKEYYNSSFYPKGELVIVKDRLRTDSYYCLAYKFDIYAHIPLSRDYIFVDAENGDIVDTQTRLYFANATGTAATRYSGTRSITTDSYNGRYRLRETRNGVRIETYNMKMTGTYSSTDFTDNDNNWTAGEFNNANKDNAALDAHWGAEMVYEYFRQVHGRNSWNNSGGPLLSYVHADLTKLKNYDFSNNDNAFWDGNKMTYGDGSFFCSPLTSLDVCAHEIAHGITEKTANLIYRGESGAINEALSDIWGACVENWATTNKQPWLIGEDIYISYPYFMRSMSNPNAGSQPSIYKGTYWANTSSSNDNGGVHTNSGVINHWFYLLSEGRRGTGIYTISGIGIEDASKIVYYTQSVILASANTQTVTFAQFREATISAAKSLFGVKTKQVASVTNAWYAVGVGDFYPGHINDSYFNQTLCKGDRFSFEINYPPNQVQSIVYETTPNIRVEYPGFLAAFTTIGSGYASIIANITVAGKTQQVKAEYWISEGYPSKPEFNYPVNSGGTYQTSSRTVEVRISNHKPDLSYYWESDRSDIRIDPYTGASFPGAYFHFPGNGFYTVRCYASNHCNEYHLPQMIYVQVSNSKAVIYPNPVSDVLTIKTNEHPNTEMHLYNDKGYLIRQIKTDSENTSLNVEDLPDGNYFIHIYDEAGKKKHVQQIIIQH